MADVVEEPSDAPLAVEQVSQSFEQPMGFEPADTPPPAETQDTEVQPSADDGSSSSIDDEAESKKIEESTPIPPSYLASESHEYAAAVDTTPASPSEKWNQLLDKVHPSVMKHAETVANHPVVNLLRQRAGQAHQSVVNHLYVQKGASTIKASGTATLETGKKVRHDPRRFITFVAAIIVLVALCLLYSVLTQKYPECGAANALNALKAKLSKGHQEL
ncbi:uncharacterized protein [Physcomitrium patens]|uniref:Uncharacterized protein n=1 Tax=Physcomitrium patens TaxID=3218 RepID=A0A2K1KKQ7_PHYPA|nr:uncharacterized protein LOC112282163 [Physcomitrium patens]PNR54355.1 hypothetical protein PHYPA_008032 [Physcomitrium patens]|eukprot:XP_024375248.1 uncharacterized protein LOC112282163 [Physcomitrella patens]